MNVSPWYLLATCGAVLLSPTQSRGTESPLAEALGVRQGIVCLVGLPEGGAAAVLDLARTTELTIYFQSPEAAQVTSLRQLAAEADLLGRRIFAETGPATELHLADNVADALVAGPSLGEALPESEALRVLHPRAVAHLKGRASVKAVPAGSDEWTHPFHGPDNNPQSTDATAKGRLRTQFIADPKFSPMPEQSVIAGGRLYKALGHIAHKANQNDMLNTLLCINAWNGTILWRHPLPEGFMIHRNTMIATEDALYMGDAESCKIYDGLSGAIRDEIQVPEGLSDGPVWKWMGLRDGILYALVGNREVQVETLKSQRRGLGHWPWDVWKGHEFADPNTSFGFGRTLLAIDTKTKLPVWHYRDEAFLDARAICMNEDTIICYAPEKFLAGIDRLTGRLLWKNTDADLLGALGPNARAQHYITGYATTSYLKCDAERVYFAGPQREVMVVASARDGHLLWTHPTGNLQLVLRQDGVYAAGPQNTNGARLDYETGAVLGEFPARRACTRATGGVDSIFFRASGGTVRLMTGTNTAQHVAPMRPPCQDGVLISNGQFYWGPWMCGCQLSLYGNIACAPADEAPLEDAATLYRTALTTHGDRGQVAPLGADPDDWLRYRGDDQRSDNTRRPLPGTAEMKWKTVTAKNDLPTAPVAAGGLVFVGDRTGRLRAWNADTGELVWQTLLSTAIWYPPAISQDRLFLGAADGKVHAFEAKTGRPLWSFRTGPRERLIPVFGRLVSSWPVAGGVAVAGDTVYAAAGITHYDGTFVVALDAATGRLKAANTSSGTLSSEVDNGISLQGNLSLQNGELQFLGGGVYETARYDLETLACRNEPVVQITSSYRTAFYPYYPEYGKYLSLSQSCSDGCVLTHDANYEGLYFNNLALEEPRKGAAPTPVKDAAGEFIRQQQNRRNAPAEKVPPRWQDRQDRRFTSFLFSKANDRLLAAGHPDGKPEEAFLVILDAKDGHDLWLEKLPVPAVTGGTAMDHAGRIFVTLENGELRCYRGISP
ncbi:MAG: PQQ-binding-like beta-propeller repeat protein [Akkermansiaceae bacterium]|nr:PQQ-binding-like beta-propeller repeat protein [Akkermansiaceae bacterium]